MRVTVTWPVSGSTSTSAICAANEVMGGWPSGAKTVSWWNDPPASAMAARATSAKDISPPSGEAKRPSTRPTWSGWQPSFRAAHSTSCSCTSRAALWAA